MSKQKPVSDKLTEPKLSCNVDKLYAEIGLAIRDTDKISFKLLGLVPFFAGSGAALLSYLLEEKTLSTIPVVFIALLGALITFALYRWELQNIQTCHRLLERAEILERNFGLGNLAGCERPLAIFGQPFGKPQAETLIYVASMLAWGIPLIVVLI